MSNQNPEQIAKNSIYKKLIACGWVVQGKNRINFIRGTGVAAGYRSKHLCSSITNLKIHLVKPINENEKLELNSIEVLISTLAKEFLYPTNQETAKAIEDSITEEKQGESRVKSQVSINKEQEKLRNQSSKIFTTKLNKETGNIDKIKKRKIDLREIEKINID
jgi:hypothetical protein